MQNCVYDFIYAEKDWKKIHQIVTIIPRFSKWRLQAIFLSYFSSFQIFYSITHNCLLLLFSTCANLSTSLHLPALGNQPSLVNTFF